jgi:hypothetical protein
VYAKAIGCDALRIEIPINEVRKAAWDPATEMHLTNGRELTERVKIASELTGDDISDGWNNVCQKLFEVAKKFIAIEFGPWTTYNSYIKHPNIRRAIRRAGTA